MFTHLLVPLDGSSLAEAVLPYVRLLGAQSGARVTLLHLIERGAPASVHGERHLRSVADADAYLREVAAALVADGVTVETHVDTNEAGDTAGRIVDHASEWGADLTILCAHGRSGVGRWLFGSIAQRVLAVGIAPVLLVRPEAGRARTPIMLHTILVPLDGTANAEVTLPLVADIARAMDARVELFMVIPTTDTLSGAMSSVARFSPNVTTTLLNDAEKAAVDYLDTCMRRLCDSGVTTTATVTRGDTADELVAAAKTTHADIVAMASHGRQGLAGIWAGSVGNKVLARVNGPFLLIRAPGIPRDMCD